MTALMRLDSTKPRIVSRGICTHFWIAWKSSSALRKCVPRKRFKPQMLIGVEIWLWVGRRTTRTLTLGYRNYRFISFAVCLGSLSCWNNQPVGMWARTYGSIWRRRISVINCFHSPHHSYDRIQNSDFLLCSKTFARSCIYL